MVGIADALADLLIKFCDLGQKRFTGKVRNICNADKYIGEKAGGKDGKGSSCQIFRISSPREYPYLSLM